MFLISAYFDEATQDRINEIITRIERCSGNNFLRTNLIPPHLTLSSFDNADEEILIKLMKELEYSFSSLEICFVSPGQLMPSVMYLAPVLNRSMYDLSEWIYERLNMIGGIRISQKYRPFSWLPHVTVGKHLDQDEMIEAFRAIQSCFRPFNGKICELGLAKTRPYRDIVRYRLKEG